MKIFKKDKIYFIAFNAYSETLRRYTYANGTIVIDADRTIEEIASAIVKQNPEFSDVVILNFIEVEDESDNN